MSPNLFCLFCQVGDFHSSCEMRVCSVVIAAKKISTYFDIREYFFNFFLFVFADVFWQTAIVLAIGLLNAVGLYST